MGNREQFDAVFARERDWSPEDRLRARRVVERLPADARTVLDAGCGTGTVTRAIADSGRQVTGMDLSGVAVERVRALGLPCVEGAIDAMPFPDRAFELALSCEVLEHLPDDRLPVALRELARVAGRWVLLTVPNRDHLPSLQWTCPECGARSVPWGHVRSFAQADLPGLVPGFRCLRTEAFGPAVADGWHPLTRLLRAPKALRPVLTAGMRCPACAYIETRRIRELLAGLPPARAGVLALTVAAALLEARIAPTRPRWLLALYERADG